MNKVTRMFSCRAEELPALAEFLKTSFLRDQADFLAYSPEYNSDYVARYDQLLLTVEAAVSPAQLTTELKNATRRARTDFGTLRSALSRLEGYVERAAQLTIAPKDFGFSAVRKGLDAGSAESVLASLKLLFQHVDANQAALQAKGFTTEARAELAALQVAIKTANADQNRLLDQRELLVQSNLNTFNDLWKQMSDIADAGKRIYKDTDPVRTKDYTLSHLKTRVRQEREREVLQPVA